MKIAENTLQLPDKFRLIEVSSQEDAQQKAKQQKGAECWYIENKHGCKYLCVTVTE